MDNSKGLFVSFRLSDVDKLGMRFQVLQPGRQELTDADAGPSEDPQHEVVPGAAGLCIVEKCLHLFFFHVVSDMLHINRDTPYKCFYSY